MFTGLIQKIGQITKNSRSQVKVRVPSQKIQLGDSIAINGVCLTVIQKKKGSRSQEVQFDISPETLKKTTLGGLKPGVHINIEPSLTLKDSLGGHIVQGHVDGVGHVRKITQRGPNKTFTIEAPQKGVKYLVSKGSIAVDGVSLTVTKVTKNQFSVALIPYTLKNTNLGSIKVGTPVNLEADIIGKYVQKYLRRK